MDSQLILTTGKSVDALQLSQVIRTRIKDFRNLIPCRKIPILEKKRESLQKEGKNGCKKGVDCDFDHPTLCRYSVKKRLCTNLQCTYVHLAGTAREEGTNKTKTSSQQGKDNDGKRGKKNQSNTKRTDSSSKSQGDSFLELKSLVKSIQASFQAEISKLKASMNQQIIPMYATPS